MWGNLGAKWIKLLGISPSYFATIWNDLKTRWEILLLSFFCCTFLQSSSFVNWKWRKRIYSQWIGAGKLCNYKRNHCSGSSSTWQVTGQKSHFFRDSLQESKKGRKIEKGKVSKDERESHSPHPSLPIASLHLERLKMSNKKSLLETKGGLIFLMCEKVGQKKEIRLEFDPNIKKTRESIIWLKGIFWSMLIRAFFLCFSIFPQTGSKVLINSLTWSLVVSQETWFSPT